MENTRNNEQIEVEGSAKRNKTLVVAVVALSLVAVIAVVVAVAFATRINRVESVNATDSAAMADELPAETVNNEPCGDYPFTSLRKLVCKDILNLCDGCGGSGLKRNIKKLRIMRNEIYARHGYIFDSEDMRRHFSNKEWYEPISKDVVLSEIEKFNIEYIKLFEEHFKGMFDGDDDYMPIGWDDPHVSPCLLYCECDDEMLLNDDGNMHFCRGLNVPHAELSYRSVMRNAIYAFNGYIFKNEIWREFFMSYWWYRPVNETVQLSETEKHNVELIKRYEKERYGVAN